MTREEAIEQLQDARDGYKEYLSNDALDMAIKALEQQDILSKTRAEIEQAADKEFQIAMGIADLNERYTHIQTENAYRQSLNIIDKYKTESEGQGAII